MESSGQAEHPFPAPLIILAPPRSFSSVVSTMLGEHPQMYGFPELHLFLGGTVEEIIHNERRYRAGISGPHGVLRSLAQLHDGIQTTATLVRAAAWLNERTDWSTKKLMDYLFERVRPEISVEKTPLTSFRPEFMERAYAYYPDAYYLHLTRHPVANRKSLREFQVETWKARGVENYESRLDQLMTWHFIHSNILRFSETLPQGQTMRIRGEDVLSEPDVYLPQIAEWLGLRTDRKAIEAMKHPENSPYAFFAPQPARQGNDPKFLRSPELRPGKVRQPSLEDFFQRNSDLSWLSGWVIDTVGDSDLQLADGREIEEQIAGLAGMLGYW
jgi:hypothetical protein